MVFKLEITSYLVQGLVWSNTSPLWPLYMITKKCDDWSNRDMYEGYDGSIKNSSLLSTKANIFDRPKLININNQKYL